MKTYQELAARTLNGDPNHTALERLANMLWGLAGEVAEFYDALMTDLSTRADLIGEGGDIRWYIAGIHSCLQFDEQDTKPANGHPSDLRHLHVHFDPLFMALFHHICILQEYAKKRYFHKKEVDDIQFKVQLNYIRSYYEAILLALNLDLAEVEGTNIAKLEKRYPNGFSIEDSHKRQDTIAFNIKHEE